MFLVERDCMTAQEQQIQAEIEKLTSVEPGATQDTRKALARISELASMGLPEAASIAAELLEQIRGTADLAGDLSAGQGNPDQWLKEGLIRLQDAVRRETSAGQAVAG